MRDIFHYEKLKSYPHMAEKDKVIWEKFIDENPNKYLTVQYDFHVGEPPGFNTLMDNGEDKNQDMLYRLRIDVIGHSEKGSDIIELKPKAGPSSIGQIKGYRTLYVRDEDVHGPVGMIIATDVAMPNMDYLCKEEGVGLVVV